MSPAARSLFVFGLYAILAGLGLVVAPAMVLGLLGFPPAADGWVRVVGVLAVCVGSYHIVAARNELRPYFRASVTVRIGFALGLAALVVAALMSRALLLFAAIDLLGAAWTAWALRRPHAATAATPAV
jgi:hypothetical protein